MKTKRNVSYLVVVVCMLIAAASVNAVVWNVNDDLAAAGWWPAEGSPVVGPWSMGLALSSSPWDVSLFTTYVDWGNNCWLTDLDMTMWTYHPVWHCMGHGGVLVGAPSSDPYYQKCLLAPSSVIQDNDPNEYVQYTVLAWISPIATPEVTIWGQYNKTYSGDLTDHFIIKCEPETSEPNYFINHPGEDPNDYVETLFTKINDTLPVQDGIFNFTTSVEVGTRILFAIKRNPHASTVNNTWLTLDAAISDTFTCQDQNRFMNMDFNKDCYVNLEDFALFADRWLDCNDPQNETCTATVP